MATWWHVHDVSAWPVEAWDPRGRRAKAWVAAPDGGLWLRKLPRESRPTEPAVEVFALQLAARVGIVAARAHPCIFTVDGQPVRGIVSARFVEPGPEDLWTGDVLLGRLGDYDPERYELHSPDLVRDRLTVLDAANGTEIVAQMLEVLIFDAWIGNADRHQQNWAVVVGSRASAQGEPESTARLAQMFDPACCLGVERQDSDVLLRDPSAERLVRYRQKCGSGFGDGNQLISMETVVVHLRRWPGYRDALERLVARFRRALDTEVQALLTEVPDDWLSPARKHLAWLLLNDRLNWLASIPT